MVFHVEKTDIFLRTEVAVKFERLVPLLNSRKSETELIPAIYIGTGNGITEPNLEAQHYSNRIIDVANSRLGVVQQISSRYSPAVELVLALSIPLCPSLIKLITLILDI
ncbi:hypothetical protein WA026_013053, partial [Henosepilachna vigintioctopunctata]